MAINATAIAASAPSAANSTMPEGGSLPCNADISRTTTMLSVRPTFIPPRLSQAAHEKPPNDLLTVGAERGANADLAHPLTHGESDDCA